MAAATIKDVAARANVSVMTVSRVLSGRKFVSEDKRERVLAAIAELRFRRNPSARGLPEARTYVLALIAGQIPHYVAEIERGAIRQCRRSDYHLVVVLPTFRGDDPVTGLRKALSSLRVDGVILLPPLGNNPAVLDWLDQRGLPYVRIAPDDQPGRAPSVGIDDVAAGEAITDHLLDLGHRRIGFIQGPANHGDALRRQTGYIRALERRGVVVNSALIAPGDFTFLGGLRAASRLLSLPNRPTAIFAANDDMALGVMSAASRAGLSTPDELAVAGFDDSEGARQSWPMLTTIRQPMADMGQAAAQFLIERSGRDGANLQPETRSFGFELVVRGSTAAVQQPGGAVEPRTISL
ncbi:LacI family DNA-binding transcriptional regulator [Phenylobacterium montanum]|uniref:LacI family DNA-binding transcriptional regulator n=1 Tax=Phenylobacterium montanum TaxID=2823693 RepID=A0A975IW26_9CAUL|nr:LacI family DNA-binding transcriptional regulator [Caulobacter sp. S6]QUD89642.1 LacI family DNA-binding transcriptional regulator [Caulobacter sp. S6]